MASWTSGSVSAFARKQRKTKNISAEGKWCRTFRIPTVQYTTNMGIPDISLAMNCCFVDEWNYMSDIPIHKYHSFKTRFKITTMHF
jgi:hypothetical protein